MGVSGLYHIQWKKALGAKVTSEIVAAMLLLEGQDQQLCHCAVFLC